MEGLAWKKRRALLGGREGGKAECPVGEVRSLRTASWSQSFSTSISCSFFFGCVGSSLLRTGFL